MRRATLAALAALLSAGTLTATQQPETPAAPAAPADPIVVPVHREPHHRQVFQYGPMRILDLQIPPNDMSWFHRHEWPVLYLTLGTSQTRTQILGSDWGGRAAGRGPRGQPPGAPTRGGAPPAGGAAAAPRGTGRPTGPAATAPRATSTTSYADQPVTHRLENIGTGLFRAMVVVNETAGDETISEQAAGFTGKPELTNRWFRAYRLTLAPGEKTPAHRHQAPVVIFQATDGKGVGAGAMRFEFNEPGQWGFFDTGDQHEIRNTGDRSLELVEVEVRRK